MADSTLEAHVTPAPKRRNWRRRVLLFLAIGLPIALISAIVIGRLFVIGLFFIPSAGMRPTLIENDHILVNRWAYRMAEPRRGDIVVFRAPYWVANPSLLDEAAAEADRRGLRGAQREEFIRFSFHAKDEKFFTKRVVAVPGDLVRITPGYVLIDGVQHTRWDIADILCYPRQPDRSTTVRLYPEKIVLNGVRAATKSDIRNAIDVQKAKIEIHPGEVYVNDKALDEPYIAEDCDAPYPQVSPYTSDGRSFPPTPDQDAIVIHDGEKCVKIPPGKLLVMGDNRNDSNDSRFWGLLDRSRVFGKVVYIYSPAKRRGAVQ